MIQLFCADHHSPSTELCLDCEKLHGYSVQRLDRCPFQEGKTICANCLVHCFEPQMRERIREVMRYSGPRILARHPVLALLHLVDGLRKAPTRSEKR